MEELVITRIYDVPRELVWRAWINPDLVTRWWGPKGFTAPSVKIDFREGGSYLYCMRSPEGQDYWSTGTYREIVTLERIVATDSFADESGKVVPPTHYGLRADFPRKMLVTLTLEDHEGKTKLTLTHEGLPPGEDRDNAEAGWSQSFDKLDEVVTGLQEQIRATMAEGTKTDYKGGR